MDVDYKSVIVALSCFLCGVIVIIAHRCGSLRFFLFFLAPLHLYSGLKKQTQTTVQV